MKKRILGITENLIIASLIITLMLGVGKEIKAAIFSSGFSTGKLTYIAESGSDSTIAANAASVWNGTSSKVSITRYTGSDPYGIAASITFSCDKYAPPVSGGLGLTVPYKSYSLTSATEDTNPYSGSTWVKAFCYQYKSTSFTNNTQRTATAAHEAGHALSIEHPDATNTTALMRQGIKNSTSLSSYDTSNLIAKWGK